MSFLLAYASHSLRNNFDVDELVLHAVDLQKIDENHVCINQKVLFFLDIIGNPQ